MKRTSFVHSSFSPSCLRSSKPSSVLEAAINNFKPKGLRIFVHDELLYDEYILSGDCDRISVVHVGGD